MKKDKKWTKANRRRALEPLYKYWKQFETWSLEECGSLVAGIDPSFPMNANGPLVPIEKTSIRTIDVLIQSAVGASLKTLETDNERVLQSTFIEWAKDHLYEFLLPEFRLIFFEESGRGISAGLIRQNQAQITGPIARRNRLREFLETENIKTDRLPITKEELHERFYKANPDIVEVKLGTFEADLKKLKIRGKRGRPESF